MILDQFLDYCHSKQGVTADYPFTGETVWMKVMGKLFTITNIEEYKRKNEMVGPFHSINLKCDPERAVELREHYPAIEPAWHQNKKHWNTVLMDNSLNDDLILELIDHSYELVVASLSKKVREELNGLSN